MTTKTYYGKYKVNTTTIYYPLQVRHPFFEKDRFREICNFVRLSDIPPGELSNVASFIFKSGPSEFFAKFMLTLQCKADPDLFRSLTIMVCKSSDRTLQVICKDFLDFKDLTNFHGQDWLIIKVTGPKENVSLTRDILSAPAPAPRQLGSGRSQTTQTN